MKYSLATVNRVCDAVAEGRRLSSVFEAKWSPTRRTFYRWLKGHPEARELYDSALEMRGDALIDEVGELRKELKHECDHGRVKAIEVAIKTLQWEASRLNRLRWGERVHIEHETKWGDLVERIQGARARAAAPKPLALPPARRLSTLKPVTLEAELVGSPLPPAKRTRKIEVDV